MFYHADTPPTEYPASEVVEAFGPFWIIAHHRAGSGDECMFESRMTIGFDPVASEYVGTYISTLAAQEARFRGRYDAATQTLHWSGSGMGPLGPATRFRAEETARDENSKTFRMWAYDDSTPEYLLMEYSYTRKS
jgi:hypothetical protein